MNPSRPSSFALSERGSASLEFAMFSVVGILLLLAGTDLAAYLRSKLRLDQVAGSTASFVTGYQQLYEGDFATLFQAAQQIAGAIAVGGQDGATIITGMTNPAGTPTVAWQRRTGNAGFTSAFGAVGGRPQNLPDKYALPAGSSVVAVEVFSSIHPWVLSESVMGTAGSPTLRSAALYQPRGSLLSEISAEKRP